MGERGDMYQIKIFLVSTLLVFCCSAKDSECNGTVTGRGGTLTSPGYPNNYDNDVSCHWLIYVPHGNVISLTSQTFELERCGDCVCDAVTIYDGDTRNHSVLGTFCGHARPNVTSTSNTMFIEFETDSTNTALGFVANWTSKPAPRYKCGGLLTRNTGYLISQGYPQIGYLSSPGYPRNYQNNANCTWLIRAPRGKVVTLTFDTLDLEPCGWWCHCDSLTVFDGASDNSHSLGRFCGSATPRDVISSGSLLMLQFITDGTSNRRGFNVSWTFGPANSNVTATDPPTRPENYTEFSGAEGNLTSPGYPGDYASMTNRAWLITSPEGTVVTLTFDTVDIEECEPSCLCDAVTIFDGDSDRSRVIRKLCGTSTPTVVSTGNSMYVQFLTDMSYSRSGFRAHWTSGPGH